MKKTLLIIMSVAVLGALGMYINKPSSSASNLVPPANTSTNPVNQSTTGSNTTSASQTSSTNSTTYKDGTYDGSSATPYGEVGIAVVISGGKISNVQFLQMPSDQGHSREVTAFAEPLLKQTTLQNQSANIDFVSGATSTSYGFEQSLQTALDQAKMS
jgi:uncharacterized protein with FMN-binding domain